MRKHGIREIVNAGEDNGMRREVLRFALADGAAQMKFKRRLKSSTNKMNMKIELAAFVD